jgi:hypothetical protein
MSKIVTHAMLAWYGILGNINSLFSQTQNLTKKNKTHMHACDVSHFANYFAWVIIGEYLALVRLALLKVFENINKPNTIPTEANKG